MNLKTTHLVLIVLLSVAIGFFIGRAFPSQTANQASEATPTPESKTIVADNTDSKSEDADADADASASADGNASDERDKSADEVPEKLETPNTPAVTSSAVLKRVKMGISDDKISQVLTSISKNLEAKNLEYDSDKSQDCSGIFFQIKDSIQVRLPALKQNAGYKYPQYGPDRTSRRIADWYYRNNNLVIVDNPITSKNSIRPGTVMFFGKSRKGIQKLSINDLTDRDNSFTKNGIIMHVAVVTQVFIDDNGNVTGYDMMHGRNSSTPASRSGSKEIQSTNTKGLPPFGNWSQHWVAAANIATPE